MTTATAATTTAPTERRLVGMLMPPPVLFGLLVKVAFLVQFLALGGVHASRMSGLVGGLLIAASMALLAASKQRFHDAGTPVRPKSRTTAIVDNGPYRFTRNPMYLAMAGVMTGLAVILGSLALAVAAVAFVVVVHYGVVLREERYLLGLYGDTYRGYMQRVRRWI